MELTSEQLLRALAVCCGEEPEDPAEAVVLVHRSQPSLAATLWSAWEAEGKALNPALAYELAAVRGRIEYYRALAGRLRAHVPGLFPVKGLEVADRYPAGLARAMNDLDFVAPVEADLWRAVRLLLDEAWDLHTATFTYFAGALQVLVSLRRPNEDEYALPYGVEVATYVTLGDMGAVAPLAVLPEACRRSPVLKNAMMLLYERFEQPYRARDLVDATLLLGSLDANDTTAWRRVVGSLGLWSEYAELVRLVAAAGLAELPAPPPVAWVRSVTRVRRAAHGLGLLRYPVAGAARHLQRRHVAGRSGAAGRQIWQLAQRRLSVATAVREGLLAFGLPLDGPAPDCDRARLWQRSEYAWVDTPVARFLLTIGDEVPESAVEELGVETEPAAGSAR